MTRPVFIPNALLEEELKVELKAHERDVADECADEVRAAAPVNTGRFRRGIRSGSSRGHAAVISDDPFSHLVEWGSKNNPPYAPIRRGVERAGYVYEDGRGTP